MKYEDGRVCLQAVLVAKGGGSLWWWKGLGLGGGGAYGVLRARLFSGVRRRSRLVLGSREALTTSRVPAPGFREGFHLSLTSRRLLLGSLGGFPPLVVS